jgi:hypothetical protein
MSEIRIKPTSEVVACCVDSGIFHEAASKIGEVVKKMYYCVPSWANAYPSMNVGLIGYGMPHLTIVDSPFGGNIVDPEGKEKGIFQFDDVDLFIFFDVHFGAMQDHLVSLGKKVWGSRLGEEMELKRVGMKDLMVKKGLPVGNYKVVHGMDNLREHLKTHKNQHVKIDKFRDTMETFHSKHYQMIEPKLDEIEHKIGAFKHIIDFVCEDGLDDKVEIGTDAYTVDGKFPSKLLAGIEIKGSGFVGVFKPYKEFPKSLTHFNDVIAPTLKAYGYRGAFSTEVRIGKDGVGYMVDFCARNASPPNELYQEFYLNFADIVWYGANGIMVDPKPVSKFGAEAIMYSSWAQLNWQPIRFPAELKRFVKLRNATMIKGQYYNIPQHGNGTGIGAVIGWGDTLQEAEDMVKKVAEQVEGFFIEIDTESFDRADAELKKCEKYGIKMF